ncbi:hypothetical protein [Bradyrhizobium sp. Gha]|uniref:hypothetical protein n=1 Tax=Bradyrhizobium sp. Gha TaxID=1855318 RepID=UPI0015A6BA51|nr:hypothetical protein [Bradyrhizobium sp. Gha]
MSILQKTEFEKAGSQPARSRRHFGRAGSRAEALRSRFGDLNEAALGFVRRLQALQSAA